MARLLQGGFRSQDLLSDGLLIALVETGVPVWALDADRVDVTGLGIRTTLEGERFGSGEHRLAEGRLVVADAREVQALLFGAIAPGHGVGPADTTRRPVRRRSRWGARHPRRGGALGVWGSASERVATVVQ